MIKDVSQSTGGVCCFRIGLLHGGLTAGHTAESERIGEPKETQTVMPCERRECQHLVKAIVFGQAMQIDSANIQLHGETALTNDASSLLHAFPFHPSSLNSRRAK
jgi:hypothetical protein